MAGRIGTIIALQDIDEALMINILLKSPSSPFIALKAKLAINNCSLSISRQALDNLVSRQADAIKKFGVRGIFQGFNQLP
ncbi:hypothetical protein [Faucicola boevrei]|uniref:hypothetical protein n=1 Tax=Faucicola boevrei TaxID=346665 RepID=UPI000372D3CD|nr:hypothetical protein [Moraxella boevrei]